MRILLLNENPVVTKLVTLSAQKTADELEVTNDLSVQNAAQYDLIVVDDALYSESIKEQLQDVAATKRLFMATRGSELPQETFDYILNKPFLPTDLVELFSGIASGLGVSVEEEEAIETLDNDSDLPELEGLEDDTVLEIDNLEADDDLSLHHDDDDTMTLDLDDDIASDESDELLLDDMDMQDKEPVLDKDDLAEVQELLDDTEEAVQEDDESTIEDAVSVESELDAIEGLEDDALLPEDDSEEMLPDEEAQVSNDGALLDNLDDGADAETEISEDSDEALALSDQDETEELLEEAGEALMDDLEEDIHDESADTLEAGVGEALEDDLEDLSDDALGDLDLSDIEDADEIDDLDDEIAEEIESIDAPEALLEVEGDSVEPAVAEDDFEDLSDDVIDDLDLGDLESIDAEEESDLDTVDIALEDEDVDLDAIEDEIESAVSELSAEELEADVDEDLLLNIATDETTFDAISGLDELDEQSIKVAVGEADATQLQEETRDEMVSEEHTQEIEKASNLEGAEALKVLLQALENREVAKALKGMNISINISFGEMN